MTPAARIAAAIQVLDSILDGAPAEKTLTNWARQNRYAGSGDRAAIRDHVFDALRQRRSAAWLGGTETGRGLMIGILRKSMVDPETIFTGEGYAPSPLSEAEKNAALLADAPPAVALDCPDWLYPEIESAFGPHTPDILAALQSRAPVFLRVNTVKADVPRALESLREDEIETQPHPLSPTALSVTRNPRRVQHSRAYRDGLVELQDAASQALVDRLLPLSRGKSVLDYCAGGGGKSLALAAGGAGQVTAHDAHPQRMGDIPERADRAGTPIEIVTSPDGTFDLVLCDAPCSGSGAWRRQPDAKWRLTPQKLKELPETQIQILQSAKARVAEDGVLAYATCSLLTAENEDILDRFLTNTPGWTLLDHHRFTPLDGGDGFFLATFQRVTPV